MKTLKEALVHKHMDHKKSKYKDPKVGTWCYDYNGDKWRIEAIYQYGNDPEQIEADIAMYDDAGFLDEVIEMAEPGDFIVGVSDEPRKWCAVYIWGPEGCCYENK